MGLMSLQQLQKQVESFTEEERTKLLKAKFNSSGSTYRLKYHKERLEVESLSTSGWGTVLGGPAFYHTVHDQVCAWHDDLFIYGPGLQEVQKAIKPYTKEQLSFERQDDQIKVKLGPWETEYQRSNIVTLLKNGELAKHLWTGYTSQITANLLLDVLNAQGLEAFMADPDDDKKESLLVGVLNNAIVLEVVRSGRISLTTTEAFDVQDEKFQQVIQVLNLVQGATPERLRKQLSELRQIEPAAESQQAEVDVDLV